MNPYLKNGFKRLDGEDNVEGGEPVVEPSWPVLGDEDGLVRLELQQAIHVGLAPKLEVGRHELAGKAAPVVGGVGGI